jgi:hypothetical protein
VISRLPCAINDAGIFDEHSGQYTFNARRACG